MSVHMMNVPTTNSTGFRIGAGGYTLEPGDAVTITATVSHVVIKAGGNRQLDQMPDAPVNINPGNVAWFESDGNDVILSYGPPGGQQSRVKFR